MAKIISKSELLAEFASRHPQYTEESLNAFVERILEYVQESLLDGYKVGFRGFGNFVVWKKEPRWTYRPNTQHREFTQGRYAVRFRPSKCLKDRLNS